MARFRRSGKNWEGRNWETPPSLNALLDEIEAAYPAPRSLDGTVASKAHDRNSPTSDHRPKPTSGPGIVRAVDIGENEPEGDVIAEAIRKSKDPRVKYVIHESRIFSSYSNSRRKAWEWGSYTGHSHATHVHVSTVTIKDPDGSPWNLGLSPKGEEDDMLNFTIGPLGAPSVGGPEGDLTGDKAQALQEALLQRGEKLPKYGPDRYAGDETRHALRAVQGKGGVATSSAEYKNGVVGPKTHALLYAAGGGGVTSDDVSKAVTDHAKNPDAHHA